MFKYSELIKDNIKYKASLITLWAIIGLSLANIITTIMWRAHAGFSFYLTKIFADFSRDYIINNENMPKEILIVVITACTVLPYVVCALFYKKRPLYAIIALGLLVVDSAMFCIDFVVYLLIGNVMSLIDFVIRVAACVILLMYVMEGRDLWYTVKDADSLEEIFGTISEAEALAESEIEVNVNMLEEIKLSGCIYDTEKGKIVLYYVGDMEAGELTKILRDKLPRYMLPNYVEKLTEMPLTPNGKINRVFLKEKYKNEH